jgi:two-component system cell cycle sensor histidine kinase/response regulator CckA
LDEVPLPVSTSRDDLKSPQNEFDILAAEHARRIAAERELHVRLAQQAAISELGGLALTGADLPTLMQRAVSILAENLRTEYTKILELLPGGQELLLKYGVGWKPGHVGRTTVIAGENSQAGYTLCSKQPVIVTELRRETRFKGPDLLLEHGVVSGMSVIIQASDGPYGILAAHTTQPREFTEYDVYFLQAISNVLADAIARERALEDLRMKGQIVDQIHDAVISTDMDGIVTNWNKGAERLFDYPAGEALGRHISFVYEEDQREFLQNKVIEPLVKQGEHKIEVRMIRRSGRPFYAHLSLSLLRDASGVPVGMIGYSMDITGRKLMAAQVHELGRVIGSFSSAIHSLRSGAWEQTELRDELLSGIESATIRVERLLGDLATLDERASGVLHISHEPMDLTTWLPQAVTTWRELARHRGLTWKLDVPPGLPVLYADPARLDQILGNLLSNAIKYSADGGAVTVSCGVVGSECWIRVEDDGPGIPLEEQAHIFMPFYRPQGSVSHLAGRGLGLTIVRDLTRAHGGRVEVDSVPDRGSRFTVWLPLAAHADEPAA